MQSYNVILKTKNKYKDKFVLNIFVKEKQEIYSYGDVLNIEGSLEIPKFLGNYGEFNYKKYLNSKKIYGTINAFKVKKVGVKFKNIIYKISYEIKEFFNKNIERSLTAKEGNLLKSMLYGDTRFLDKDLNQIFENIGITHLLAVSGSNVASVVLIAKIILEKLKIRKKFINIYLIIFVIIFTIISGCELSIVRASIMCIIMLCSDIFGRKYNIWSSIITSFYLILLYNPYSIFNVGMQLSFLATIGIVMYYKYVKKFFSIYVIDKIKNKKLKSFLDVILDLLSVTISAFILIIPVQFYYFNSFNIIMFVSNIIAVFLADIICNLGFVSLFLSPIPGVNFLSTNCILILLKLLINISNFLGIFKFLEIKLKSPNIYIILLYYSLVIVAYIYLKNRNKKILKYIYKNSYLLSLVITFTIVYNIFFNNYVVFFNVGQGDCSLIKIYSKVIVIDCGSTEKKAGRILEGYLKKNGISKIDMLIISHLHEDHINGIENLEEIEIKNIVYSRQDVLPLLNNSIPKIQVIRGEKIKVNNKCSIEVLSPGYKEIKDKDIPNANSLVIMAKLNKNKVLYMGDSTASTEKEMLKYNLEKVDVLKVGHHGSKTSSSYEFINKISPLYAIISSKKEEYGHPDKEVISTLSNKNVNIHITEIESFFKFKF